MKRKTRFNDAGNVVDPGDGTQYFAEDELAEANRRNMRAEIAAMQSEGPSSEGMPDSSMRRNLETGEYYSTENFEPKKAVRAAPKAPQIKDVPGSGRGTMAGRRAIDDIMRDAGGGGRGRSMGRTAEDKDTFTPGKGKGRAEIPVDSSMSGPEKRSSSAMNMSDTERNLMNLLMASTRGMSRVGGKAIQNNRALVSAEQMAKPMLSSAKEAVKGAASRVTGEARKAETAAEAAKAFSKPQAREVGSKVPARPSQASKERAEALEKAKPILQSRPDTKASRASRTRRTEEDAGIEFSKGGSASRRADGCATRGKTRGKIY